MLLSRVHNPCDGVLWSGADCGVCAAVGGSGPAGGIAGR